MGDCFGMGLYIRSSTLYGRDRTWSPYVIDETLNYWDNRRWIVGKYGEKLLYKQSPYMVSGNLDKHKYFIRTTSGDFICAIKEADGYLNLISGRNFNLDDENEMKNQAVIWVPFPVNQMFFI